MRAVVWAAVSDPQQLANDSVEQQRDRGRAIIAERGWREVHEPLIVPGITRSFDFLADAVAEIPAMGELTRLAREGLIDLVICRHYNRVARTASLQLQLSTYLRRNRVQIYAYEVPIEPTDPAILDGRQDTTRLFVEGFAGLVSEADNIHRVRRAQDGMITRIKRGGHPAGEAPYGYVDVVAADGVGRSNRKRIPHPVEYPILCEVLRLLRDNYSANHAAAVLAGQIDGRMPVPGRRSGTISAATITQWARNPYYAGYTYRSSYARTPDGKRGRRLPQAGLLVESDHEHPISADEWSTILHNIAVRRWSPPRQKRQDKPWSRMAVCGYCLDAGRTLMMRHALDVQRNLKDGQVRRYEYLICNHYAQTGGRECRRNTFPVDPFLDTIYTRIQQLVLDPAARAALDRPAEGQHPELARLRRELEQLARADERWETAYVAGVIDLSKYAERVRDTRDKRQEIESRILHLEQSARTTAETIRQRDEALTHFADALDRGDQTEASRLVRAIIRHVVVRKEELTIVWR